MIASEPECSPARSHHDFQDLYSALELSHAFQPYRESAAWSIEAIMSRIHRMVVRE
jgi:hypothetical protein